MARFSDTDFGSVCRIEFRERDGFIDTLQANTCQDERRSAQLLAQSPDFISLLIEWFVNLVLSPYTSRMKIHRIEKSRAFMRHSIAQLKDSLPGVAVVIG
jgi:hypothetical protein